MTIDPVSTAEENPDFFRKLGKDLENLLQQQRTIVIQRWINTALLLGVGAVIALFLNHQSAQSDGISQTQKSNRAVLDQVLSVTGPDARKSQAESTSALLTYVVTCINNHTDRVRDPSVALATVVLVPNQPARACPN